MKNELHLQEAIVIALINIDKETFCASFDTIAAFIDKRGLFSKRKAGCTLAEQVMLRATRSRGRYKHLFHQIDDRTIQLKSFTLEEKVVKKKRIIKDGLDFTDYMEVKKPIAWSDQKCI